MAGNPLGGEMEVLLMRCRGLREQARTCGVLTNVRPTEEVESLVFMDAMCRSQPLVTAYALALKWDP